MLKLAIIVPFLFVIAMIFETRNAPFTVRHFLLECGDFAQVRNNCFHVDNMKELFQDIHIDSIMTFLRQLNLFNKI